MKLVVTKLLTTVVVMAAMTTAAFATEQKIDLSAMTCRDFMASDQAKSTLILAWFLGFYGEEEDPQVIDLNKLEAARAQFADFCKQQPNFRMTVAAEGILETPEQQESDSSN
jgi:HdeA/HdeB family